MSTAKVFGGSGNLSQLLRIPSNNATDHLISTFGPIMNRLDERQPFDHDTTDTSRPAAYFGKSRELERVIFGFGFYRPVWETTLALPILETEDESFTWDEVRYMPDIMGVVPHKAHGEQLTRRSRRYHETTIRRGQVLAAEHEWITTQAGKEDWMLQVAALSNSLQLTACNDVTETLFNVGPSMFTGEERDNADLELSIVEAQELEAAHYGSINKNHSTFYRQIDHAGSIVERNSQMNARPDMLILPVGAKAHLKGGDKRETEYWLKGENAINMKVSGPEALEFNTIRNTAVFEMRSNNIQRSFMDAADPSTREVHVGEFFTLSDPRLRIYGINDKEYRSDMWNTKIFSWESNNFAVLTLRDAIRGCGRFTAAGLKTLREMVDDHNAGRKKMTGNDPMVYHENGQAFVAETFGSLPIYEGSWTVDDARALVKLVKAKGGSKYPDAATTADVDSDVIATGLAVIGEYDQEAPSSDWLAAFDSLNTTTVSTDDGHKAFWGTKATDPRRSGAAGGYIALPTDSLGPDPVRNSALTNWAALEAIANLPGAAASAYYEQAKIKAFVDAFKKLVANVKDAFKSSYALEDTHRPYYMYKVRDASAAALYHSVVPAREAYRDTLLSAPADANSFPINTPIGARTGANFVEHVPYVANLQDMPAGLHRDNQFSGMDTGLAGFAGIGHMAAPRASTMLAGSSSPQAAFQKLQNSNMYARWVGLVHSGNFVDDAIGAALLFTPINEATVDALYQHNIPLPFSFIAARPNVRTRTGSAILMLSGRDYDTGFYAMGWINMQIQQNHVDKYSTGSFTAQVKAVLKRPHNVIHLDNVLMRGYVMGRGGGHLAFTDAQDLANAFTGDNHGRSHLFKNKAIIYILTGYRETELLNNHIDITGKWQYEHYQLRPTIAEQGDVHFSGGDFVNRFFNLEDGIMTNRGYMSVLATESFYYNDVGKRELFNTRLSRGSQRVYSHETKTISEHQPGEGHFGTDQTPGLRTRLTTSESWYQ